MRQTRVLLVDDEPSVLLTIAANLELEGFEVEMADGAARALEILAERPADIVLSDIRMPGMNGVDLFRAIKRSSPGIPVVLMTAFTLETQIDEAMSERVFTVLPKPFEIAEVARILLRASRRPLVLVIDRRVSSARTMAAALLCNGLRARAARDAPGARRALRSGRVDVCVIDSPKLVASIRAADATVSVVLA